MPEKLPHNILIISNKPPYPMVDGGCFAMAKFEQLIQGCFENEYYFALATPKHPFDKEAMPDKWVLNENFYSAYIDTNIQNKHVAKYLAGSSIRAVRFYSSTIEKKIIQVIQEKNITVVFFESIYSAVYLKAIKKIPNIRTIIRTHNIEHQIWEKYYDHMKKGLKRLAFRSETARLKTFEDQCLSGSDGNIFISVNDLDYAKKELNLKNGICIPVQLKIQEYPKNSTRENLKLFHLGAMDWLPNIEGIEKFILEVFPKILQIYPSCELHLAGKSMPTSFYAYQSNHIFVHGQVENANEFISKFDVLVVPIESGSGIRIKILEAMAAGKPVITTSAGIEGIDAENGKDLLLANNLEEWISAIKALNDPANYSRIMRAGTQFIELNYSEAALKQQFTQFIKARLQADD